MIRLNQDGFMLMTIHRPSNADHDERLLSILEQVSKAKLPTIFPVHPRSRSRVEALINRVSGDIHLIDPVGYLDMMLLEKHAKMIITDSGGVQKEAYLHRTECLTVRNETEWVETVEDGWNYLVGHDLELIPKLGKNFPPPKAWSNHYGKGKSAERIVELLEIAGRE